MRQKKYSHRQSGSMVIYIIAILAVLGVISVAATSYFSASSLGTAQTNCPVAAQYLAEAGVRYAESQLRSQTDLATLTAMVTTLNTTTYTVTNAGTYNLTVGAPYDNGGFYAADVTSVGTSCTPDSPTTHTQPTITVNTNIAVGGGGSTDPETITFDPDEEGHSDVSDFPGAGTGGAGADDFVDPDTDENTLALGNNARASFGCSWYTGSKNPCDDGVCDFGSGFRTYFEAMYSYNAQGDGFVFAIVNADENTVQDCGGDTSRGELLAYAGSGTSGSGLQAPKIGLEFDIYANTGTGNTCNVGQRNDDSESRDHVSWLFWGHDYWSGGCDETYDDNRHGAGVWGGNNPVPPNSAIPTNPENIGESGAGQDGYYYDESNGGDWMRAYNSSNNSKKFRIRIEVDRSQTADANGNYCYTLKGWIVRDNVTLPDGFEDMDSDYYDQTDDSTWPQVEHMVVLNSSNHNKLDEIIFGWTASTGGATKILTISDFKLKFKDEETTCPAVAKPDDYVVAIPMYEGQGGNLHNLATGGGTGQITHAYWLKGTSCPGCASLFFDDTYGPATFWDNTTSTMTSAGTVSTWVYLKDYENYQGILHKGNETDFSDETFSLQFTAHNFRVRNGSWKFNEDRKTGPWYRIDNGKEKPLFCVADVAGTMYCVNSKYQLELDKWYHLAATWNSTTDVMEFFVNGSKTATFDATDYGWDVPVVSNAWNELIVGAQTSGGLLPFNGMVDDVYMYDRVLTDEEITNLYNDGHQSAQEEE